MKVFAFGIDSATLDLILPWAGEGELPTFRRMMKEGAWGPLKSTLPHLTPPAWTSSLTGKNPGKHNIFDFLKPEPGTYKKKVVNAQDRKSPALWNLLSARGRKVGVLSVPITFPPEEVNGFLVTGMMTPSQESGFTFPPSLKKDLLEEVGYRIGIDLRTLLKKNRSLFEKEFLKEVAEVTESRRRALFYLLRRDDWDFFIAVFEMLDPLQHFFWKYMDKTHPQYREEEAAPYREAILDHYRTLDRILGEILDAVGEETAVIVYSDHGCGPLYRDVFINNWLEEKGYLKLKWSLKSLKWRLLRKGRFFSKGIRDRLVGDHRLNAKLLSIIDWGATEAYFFSLSGQSIRINLKGREPEGIVTAGRDYESLRDRLIGDLGNLADPETGERLVEGVFKREDIYTGPFVDQAPDLLVVMNPGYVLQEGFGEGLLMPAEQALVSRSGDHRTHGILFLKGPGVKPGREIASAEIADIAPTILYLMGEALPGDLDGRVLTDAFSGEHLEANPLRYGEAAPVRSSPDYELSAEETEALEKRLKGLGYME